MDDRDFPSPRHAAHDLSKAEGFALGPLAVDPPSRRVSVGDRSEMLEPRVMRVLIALGGAGGKVLSRDDLIAQCWDGLVVGDNAINQVISRLRHVFADLGGGAVRLETITKVGFRLVVDGQAAGVAAATVSAGVPVWRRKWTRRTTAYGLAVAGAGGALAYAGWFQPKRHVLDPRAAELYNRGQAIQKAGLPGSMRQAMDLFVQATKIDPDYADAWAALAIGYPNGGDGFVREPRSAYPRLVESAAGRALELDPDNAEAHLARIVIYPDFRRWLEHEAQFRGIARRFPDYGIGHAVLCTLLANVGRIEEGITFRRRQLEIEPMVPSAWAILAQGLHYAGQDHEADAALDEGFSRWPTHPHLWGVRYHVLIGGKRYTEAAAFARDPRSQPEMLPEGEAEGLARTADSLASRQGIEAITAAMRARPINIANMPFSEPLMAELGDSSGALDRLEAYFFGGSIEGQRVPPPDPLDARHTVVLFAPAILALRGDPRHASLLKRTGLEDYWRKSGTQPDFRRG